MLVCCRKVWEIVQEKLSMNYLSEKRNNGKKRVLEKISINDTQKWFLETRQKVGIYRQRSRTRHRGGEGIEAGVDEG